MYQTFASSEFSMFGNSYDDQLSEALHQWEQGHFPNELLDTDNSRWRQCSALHIIKAVPKMRQMLEEMEEHNNPTSRTVNVIQILKLSLTVENMSNSLKAAESALYDKITRFDSCLLLPIPVLYGIIPYFEKYWSLSYIKHLPVFNSWYPENPILINVAEKCQSTLRFRFDSDMSSLLSRCTQCTYRYTTPEVTWEHDSGIDNSRHYFQSKYLDGNALEKVWETRLALCKYEDDECSICLELIHGSASKCCQCGHIFHAACIDDWLSRGNTTCPNCRELCSFDDSDTWLKFPRYGKKARVNFITMKMRWPSYGEIKRPLEEVNIKRIVVNKNYKSELFSDTERRVLCKIQNVITWERAHAIVEKWSSVGLPTRKWVSICDTIVQKTKEKKSILLNISSVDLVEQGLLIEKIQKDLF